ncbi:metal-dependent hydrolase [Methanobrevibacter sp.]|uniref:metal-dependent hydrolase n=1 Tax=Methanobrevibacter sp. TaxID=66852 RepID=UPI0038691B91
MLIALTFIGANIPDFDHKFKKDNVYKLIILGLIIFISLYILKLPYYIGLIIVFLGVTFYFSEHRSFTHSIFGVLTLTSAVSLVLIWGYELIISTTILSNSYMIFAILIALLSFLFLNKKLLMVFLPIFFVSLFLIDVSDVTYVHIFLALFLGLFSHIVLDSFTPAGIKIFAPISSKKVHKNFALLSIFVIILIAIFYNAPVLFNLFEQYALGS